jgi:hypothetical protein
VIHYLLVGALSYALGYALGRLGRPGVRPVPTDEPPPPPPPPPRDPYEDVLDVDDDRPVRVPFTSHGYVPALGDRHAS